MPISWLDTGASGASSEDVYRKPVLSLITQSVGMDSMLTLLQHMNGVPLVTLDHFFYFCSYTMQDRESYDYHVAS